MFVCVPHTESRIRIKEEMCLTELNGFADILLCLRADGRSRSREKSWLEVCGAAAPSARLGAR